MGRADIATCLISAQTARLQRTQIIWHVAELSQHGRIAEIASSRITSAAERGCAAIDRVLPRAQFERLVPHLHTISLPQGSVLFESGNEVDQVYLPHFGMISVQR
jgi:hypothetical protein